MRKKKLLLSALAVLTAACLFTGCGQQGEKTAAQETNKNEITVGVTPGASEEIMEVVIKEAEKEGLTVHLKTFSDYVTPDQALASGESDINVYQHKPFLDAFNEKNGTHLVSIGKTYLAPLGLYSAKYKKLADIPDGAKVAIPNDPSNGGRALILLAQQGWIKLDESKEATKVTVQDIKENPKHLELIEMEAAQLPRSLDDTDASVINAGYAISAGLNSEKDSLVRENDTSPYVNIIAARAGEENTPAYQKFVKVFQSDAVKKYVQENYAGELIPEW